MSIGLAVSEEMTFESLYSTHYVWLVSVLTRKIQSSHDADDIVQDTFIRLIGSDLGEIRNPKSFIYTIANHVMLDLFRRRRLEEKYYEIMSRNTHAETLSTEQREIILQTLMFVDNMLKSLGERNRLAFLIYHLENKTYKDIAIQLNVSVSSVKKYIAKATEHCLVFRLEHGL